MLNLGFLCTVFLLPQTNKILRSLNFMFFKYKYFKIKNFLITSSIQSEPHYFYLKEHKK